MTDISFSYNDYTTTRTELLKRINEGLTQTDKEFILSFESGNPDWTKCRAGDLSMYPSVQWKMLNIEKLKKINPQKFKQEIARLKEFLELDVACCR